MRDVRRRLQRLLRYLTRALALQTAKLAEHADLRAGQARFTHVFIHLPAYGFCRIAKRSPFGMGCLHILSHLEIKYVVYDLLTCVL